MLLEGLASSAAAPLSLCLGQKIQTKDAINLCGTHFSATQPIRASPSIAGASRQGALGAFFAPVAEGEALIMMQLVSSHSLDSNHELCSGVALYIGFI